MIGPQRFRVRLTEIDIGGVRIVPLVLHPTAGPKVQRVSQVPPRCSACAGSCKHLSAPRRWANKLPRTSTVLDFLPPSSMPTRPADARRDAASRVRGRRRGCPAFSLPPRRLNLAFLPRGRRRRGVMRLHLLPRDRGVTSVTCPTTGCGAVTTDGGVAAVLPASARRRRAASLPRAACRGHLAVRRSGYAPCR